MKDFKKKTVALVLASTIAVAGSYAADKYKNCLMNLELESGTNGAVQMVLYTKEFVQNNVSFAKKDATTYIMTLPEYNSQAPTPDLSKAPNVQSVNIQTRPYTSNGNGYTRITVKTSGAATILPMNRLYVAKDEKPLLNDKQSHDNIYYDDMQVVNDTTESNSANYINKTGKNSKAQSANTNTELNSPVEKKSKEVTNDNIKEHHDSDYYNTSPSTVQFPQENTEDSNVTLWGIVALISAAIGSVYYIITGKNKMSEVIGNHIDIDLTDDEQKKTKKQGVKKKVKHNKPVTIKPLSKPVNTTHLSEETHTEQIIVEKINVIDMDELYNAQNNALSTKVDSQNKDDQQNDALEDFLNSYYDEEVEQNTEVEEEQEQEVKEQTYIDEEVYNNILHNEKLAFSQNDINKISNILAVEITEEAKQQAKTSAGVTNPITAQNKPSPLENLLIDYYTKQQILFTEDDIKIIQDLMNVELDKDFVTDLRTGIIKIASPTHSEPHTMNIINSMYNNTEVANVSENGQYNISILKISDELPDLQDVLAHPEKYEEREPERVEVDEETLLQTLSGVQFKPFYTEEDDKDISETKEESLYEIQSKELENTTDNIVKDTTDVSDYEALLEIPDEKKSLPKNDSQKPMTIVMDNIVYSIKSVTYFDQKSGCYLTQTDNKYAVLGFVGEKILKLKEYESLKSEKISARVNDVLDDDTIQYLVKIGLNKFIINFDKKDITYVMDLC